MKASAAGWTATIVLALAVAWPGAADATTYVTETFTCPIGGEKFKARSVVSNITFGQRPDGKPYSPLPVYPIPECPSNGLLLFEKDFGEDELAVLAAAIATDEYRAMRDRETPRYRAWWLMTRLKRPALERAYMLFQAPWESDDDWDRKVRYMAAFVNEVAALERTEDEADAWFWITLRAANSLRELGHFDKAAAMIERATAPGNLPGDPEAAEGARTYVAALAALVAERNPLSEPASLVPARFAAVRCTVPRPALTPSEERACARPEVAEAVAEFRTRDDEGRKLTGEAAIRFLDQRRRAQD